MDIESIKVDGKREDLDEAHIDECKFIIRNINEEDLVFVSSKIKFVEDTYTLIVTKDIIEVHSISIKELINNNIKALSYKLNDKDIAIKVNLEDQNIAGYKVLVAEDGEKAKDILYSSNVDLVLLDVMLPRISGFELIEDIKKRDAPVIFITAKDSVINRVKGLRLGADDYIVKPFESIELLARIEAVARRYNKEENIIKINNMEIDLGKRIVKVDKNIIELTLKEFELLVMFIKNKNIALTRQQLLDKVWGYDYIGETRAVDMHVQRLREKLKIKDNIKTIYKIGYRFEV